MGKSIIIAPVVAGKERRLQEIGQYIAEHKADHEKSRDRAGVTMERAYSMETPQGTLVIAYWESRDDFAKTMEILARSDLPFDGWFFDATKEVHGIDLRQAPTGSPPELLFDWVDPQVTERKRGLAFASPVVAGKTEKGRAFAAEAFTKRANE